MQKFYCVAYFITYKHTKTKYDSENSEGGGRVLHRSNLVEPGLQWQQLLLEAPGKFMWHVEMALKARNQGYFTMRLFHKHLHDVFEGWECWSKQSVLWSFRDNLARH